MGSTLAPVTRFIRSTAIWLISLFAIHSIASASTLTTNAFGDIDSQGTTYFFQHDFTKPVATVSGSAAGTNLEGGTFSGTAHAFVDASNYGDLRFSGSASATVTGNGTLEAAGNASVDIIDTNWVFDNSSLTGQAGVATLSLLIDGDWTASTSSAFETAQVFYTLEIWERNASGTSRTNNYFLQSLDYRGSGPGTCHDAGISTPVPCTGLVTFTLPFVFGTPFGFEYDFTANSDTSVAHGTATASFDFLHSLLWGGISSVMVSGNSVPYTFSSDSGFDWTASSLPSDNVSEPTSIALVGLGLTVLAWRKRSAIAA